MSGSRAHQPKPGEEGYMLVAVVLMLALLLLALSAAAPAIRNSIQRDRDLETVHRGKQYIRAVKLYYKKFGNYPSNVDALVNTSEIRFLRRKYADPTTGKADWKPIRFGQAKTRPLGFFGQPIGGMASGGVGIGSGAGLTSAADSASAGATQPGSSQAGSAVPIATGSSSLFSTGTSGASGSSTTSTAAGGTTFGGAGIVGFSPGSSRQSLLLWRKKNHYTEWEFTYDPMADQLMAQGGGAGATSGALNPAGTGTGAASSANPTSTGGSSSTTITSTTQ